MANSITARRQGDEYQALFFWKQLLRLLTNEDIDTVTFENNEPAFVDDVVVRYKSPLADQQTGERIEADFYQCKYHVAQDTVFSLDAILDPEFIGSKESMLQRLYKAYHMLKQEHKRFRLTIVSSSIWQTQDDMCEYLSSEGRIRSTFYKGGPKSKAGIIRNRLATHLHISIAELTSFLSSIYFELGKNRKDLLENLNLQLENLGLLVLDMSVTETRYGGLIWKLFEQTKNTFDRYLLEKLIEDEKLRGIKPSNRSGKNKLFALRHQSLNEVAPFAIKESLHPGLKTLEYEEILLDQTDLFSNGELKDPGLAVERQVKTILHLQKFLNENPWASFAYYGIAHIPLAFMAGFQLNRKKHTYLFENNRNDDSWDLLQLSSNFSPLQILGLPSDVDKSSRDVIVKFSVSYPIINDDIDEVVNPSTTTIDLKINQPNPDSIRNAEQLSNYSSSFRAVLDAIHNLIPNTERIHLFYAGPVSLAFRCGQLISPTIHPEIIVYNYRAKDKPRYKWGLKISVPADSPDFFIRL